MNWKVLIVVVLCCLILVTGCSTKYVCPNGEVKDNWKQCVNEDEEIEANNPMEESPIQKSQEPLNPVPKVEDQEKVEEVKTSKEEVVSEVKVVKRNEFISNDIQEILNYVSRVKSLRFDYKEERSATTDIYDIYLKGDKMKIYLPIKTQVLNSLDFDSIIIKGKKAFKNCERERWCIEVGEFGEISYNKYKIITPIEWNAKIKNPKEIGTEMYNGRKVLILEDSDGTIYTVDKYYGVPLKVENNTNLYMYDNVIFNGVQDSDLTFKIIQDSN